MASIPSIALGSAASAMIGMGVGAIIDAAFPVPTEEEAFPEQLISSAAQLGLFGVMTALAGPMLVATVDRSNATNGFMFLIGALSGQRNLHDRLGQMSLQLKSDARELIGDK